MTVYTQTIQSLIYTVWAASSIYMKMKMNILSMYSMYLYGSLLEAGHKPHFFQMLLPACIIVNNGPMVFYCVSPMDVSILFVLMHWSKFQALIWRGFIYFSKPENMFYFPILVRLLLTTWFHLFLKTEQIYCKKISQTDNSD